MTRILSHEVYTIGAMTAGMKAFAHLFDTSVQHHESESVITLASTEDDLADELLNYILTLSAQELLP